MPINQLFTIQLLKPKSLEPSLTLIFHIIHSVYQKILLEALPKYTPIFTLLLTLMCTITTQNTIMVYQHYWNNLLSPCFLLLSPSPIAVRMILFKCKSNHAIYLLSTHQWLPSHFVQSEISASSTSLQPSSWWCVWRHLHIPPTSLLTSVTCLLSVAPQQKHLPQLSCLN